MGHIINSDREYSLLQQKLDCNVTGAPDSPLLIKILKYLFSPEDAELARKIPFSPTSIDEISENLNIPTDRLNDKMTDMAHRGLVIDIEHEGLRYFALLPVVIGFFEFTFMRTRNDLPLPELARLFHEYMEMEDKFAPSVFQGKTQLGRSLVHEEALPEDSHTEILDWEKASHIIKTASAVAVSLCACRHTARHLERACERELRTCLSFNYAAETVIRNGFAEKITTNEAMKILEYSKQAGMCQTGDNVQKNVTFICNCCGCCCGMINAIKTFNIKNAIVTSNWIMEVDLTKCKGCGMCAKICPVNAIEIKQQEQNNKHKFAVRDESLCLGCGVCHSACKFGGITIKPRGARVFTPETIFDRIVSMAIERGKLTNLIFDNPEKLSHRALGKIIGALEKSSPFKASMAIKPLHSAFLKSIVKEAKKKCGKISELME